MTSWRSAKYLGDCRLIPGWHCCSSCHEDADEGYFELIDCYSPCERFYILACCGAGDFLSDEVWAAIIEKAERDGKLEE